MIKKILNRWLGKKTRNYTDVPIFYVTFNLQKYRKNGAKGSCIINCLPEIKQDEEAVRRIESAVDYIRENFDMEKLIKF